MRSDTKLILELCERACRTGHTLPEVVQQRLRGLAQGPERSQLLKLRRRFKSLRESSARVRWYEKEAVC